METTGISSSGSCTVPRSVSVPVPVRATRTIDWKVARVRIASSSSPMPFAAGRALKLKFTPSPSLGPRSSGTSPRSSMITTPLRSSQALNWSPRRWSSLRASFLGSPNRSRP